MKTTETLMQSTKTKVPWWQVRRTLMGALVVVCAGLVALWLDPELRAAFVAAFIEPLAEMAGAAVRSDIGIALAFSTGAGLLIGWAVRRERMRPLSGQSAQLA